jgi:hypothetical protein
MIVEFAVAFEFAKYRTEDIIDPPPGTDMIPLEESPIMMITVRIEKYILRGMYIPFFEPGWSAPIYWSVSDQIEIISSQVIVSFDEDRVWREDSHHTTRL